MSANVIVNVDDVALTDRGNGKDFVFKAGRIAPQLGLTRLGCTLHVLPPGKAAYPYHRHHVTEELFVILSGTGECRVGKERKPLRQGDLVGAPAGGEAHQIINTGAQDLRYLAISTMGDVDVVEYPDSGKIGIGAGIKNADFKTATYVGMGRLQKADYYDGEGQS